MAALYSIVPSVESKLNSSENSVVSNTNPTKTIRSHLQLTYLGLIVCLSWNVIATTTLWIQGGLETTTLFVPIVSLVIGIPAAYLSWYQSLDHFFMADEVNAVTFDRHRVSHYCHFLFCLSAAIDPWEEKPFTGLLSAISVSEKYGLAGTFYYFGFGLFCVEATLSFLLECRFLREVAWPSVDIEDGSSAAPKNQLKNRSLVLAFVFLGTLVSMILVVFITLRGCLC